MKRILIVEDHVEVRNALRDWLSLMFPDVDISVADSAEAALERIKSTKIDVVVMDIALPGMNGIEATRVICERGERTKVVNLSVHEVVPYREKALEAGAVAFISKKDTSRELVPLLTGLLKDF